MGGLLGGVVVNEVAGELAPVAELEGVLAGTDEVPAELWESCACGVIGPEGLLDVSLNFNTQPSSSGGGRNHRPVVRGLGGHDGNGVLNVPLDEVRWIGCTVEVSARQ